VIYISHRLQEIKQVADRGHRAPRRPPHRHRARGRDHRRRDRPSHGGPRAHRAVPEDAWRRARRSSELRDSRSAACAPTCPSRCGGARSSGWPVSSARPHRDRGAHLRRQAERLRPDLSGRAGGEHPVPPATRCTGASPSSPRSGRSRSRPRTVGARQRGPRDPGPPLHRRVHPAARVTALVAQVTNTVRVKTPSLGQLVRNCPAGTSRRSCSRSGSFATATSTS